MIELKEIVGYLPYGLKIHIEDEKDYIAFGFCNNDLLLFEEGICIDIDFNHIKPYLYPLDYLTKKITVEGYNDGKPFVPMEHLDDEYKDSSAKEIIITYIKTCPTMEQLQLLYQWHFDIHGLIERGDAIAKKEK